MSGDAYGGIELRCPVCEGLDQPGLMHNPEAPYCTENEESEPSFRAWIDPSEDDPPPYSLTELMQRGF